MTPTRVLFRSIPIPLGLSLVGVIAACGFLFTILIFDPNPTSTQAIGLLYIPPFVAIGSIVGLILGILISGIRAMLGARWKVPFIVFVAAGLVLGFGTGAALLVAPLLI